MHAVTEQDWEALCNLAAKVGLPQEPVTLLQRRATREQRDPGRNVLLVGQPDSGIELLLRQWPFPDAEQALEKAGNGPLVFGADGDGIVPKLGEWTFHQTNSIGKVHLIALRLERKPQADLAAQIAALGFADVMVLVTRLAQPLNERERELAAAFAPLAATSRVLVVALPGEAPRPDQLAMVVAHVTNRMRQAGFQDGRCLGAGVWFTDGNVHRAGTLHDPGVFREIETGDLVAGRDGMLRSALAIMLAEIRRRCGQASTEKPRPVPAEEWERLTSELSEHLKALGIRISRKMAATPMDDTALRTFVLEEFRGWGAYLGIEGTWMKYVERILPGTQKTLLMEAESALGGLHSRPLSAEVVGTSSSVVTAGSPLVERVILQAKCLAIGLGCGIPAYWLVSILLPESTFLKSFASDIAFLSAMAIGYGASLRFVRPAPMAISDQQAPTGENFEGWEQVERRLVAWFRERATVTEYSCVEQCESLINRLNLEITH